MDIYGYLFICMYNSYSAVTLDTLVSTYARYQGCADPQALNNSDDHYTNIIWDIMIVSITFGNILVFITLVSSSILPCQTQTQIVLPTSSMSLSMLYFYAPFLLLPQRGWRELQGGRWTFIPIARSEARESGDKTSPSMQLKGPKKSLLQQG